MEGKSGGLNGVPPRGGDKSEYDGVEPGKRRLTPL